MLSTVSINDVIIKSKQMFKPALMVSLAYLAQSLIVATDVLIISWLGVDELAATGFVVRLHMLFFLFSLGFSLPIMALAGSFEGKGDIKGVRKIVQHSLFITLIIGTISVFINRYLLEEYLYYIEQPQYIIDNAMNYANIFLWSLPIFVWGSSIRSFMAIVGRVKIFMITGFIVFILNAILDYVLVFGVSGFIDPMGIRGAAIATIVVNIVYVLTLIYFCIYDKKLKKYEMFVRLEKLKLSIIKKLASVGLPMSIRMLCETGLMMYYYTLMATFGSIYLGAYQVAYQLDTTIFIFAIGMSVAIVTNVGIEKGKRSIKGILSASYAGMLLMGVFFAIFGILLLLFSDILVMLHFGGSPIYNEIYPVLKNMIIMIALYQIVHSACFSTLSAIDGLGKTKLSSFAIIISTIIFGGGGAYLLKQTELGGYGILLGFFASYIIVFILLLGIFIYYIKHYQKKYESR